MSLPLLRLITPINDPDRVLVVGGGLADGSLELQHAGHLREPVRSQLLSGEVSQRSVVGIDARVTLG